jgi:hypothetical protein
LARVVAFVPDLLFGSNVLGALRAAGHEAVLVGDEPALGRELPDADVLVVDLTTDPAERISLVGRLPRARTKTLAFYAHVEADVRASAEAAGFDLVVPRSRMAREGGALVERLMAAEPSGDRD